MKKINNSIKLISTWINCYVSYSELENKLLVDANKILECLKKNSEPNFYDNESFNIKRIESAFDLITMDRDDLLLLCKKYDLISSLRVMDKAEVVINHLAYSYARVDDLQMTSILLRVLILISNDLNIDNDIWNYLFSQQQPDGSFGLLSAELHMLSNNEKTIGAVLMMTIEVLITLSYAELKLKSASTQKTVIRSIAQTHNKGIAKNVAIRK